MSSFYHTRDQGNHGAGDVAHPATDPSAWPGAQSSEMGRGRCARDWSASRGHGHPDADKKQHTDLTGSRRVCPKLAGKERLPREWYQDANCGTLTWRPTRGSSPGFPGHAGDHHTAVPQVPAFKGNRNVRVSVNSAVTRATSETMPCPVPGTASRKHRTRVP